MDVSVFLRLLLFFRILKASTLWRASLRCNDKGFHSLTRASYLFFIGQENVTEKKATPERRLPDILSSRSVLGSRWSLIAHPCASIDRPRPCGLTACDRDSRSPSLRGPDESSALPARRNNNAKTGVLVVARMKCNGIRDRIEAVIRWVEASCCLLFFLNIERPARWCVRHCVAMTRAFTR